MIKDLSAPYLTPPAEAVDMLPWHRTYGDEQRPLEPLLSDWTPGSDIRLSRVIGIDLDEVLGTTGLHDDATLGIVVSWVSSSTKIRRRCYLKRNPEENQPVEIVLPGDEIGGTLELDTSLVVLDAPGEPVPGVAHWPGSILLRDSQKIILEGDGSSFPMAVVDFNHTRYNPSASWHLETTTDIDANFSATFQVLINERDEKLVKSIETDRPTKEQTILLQELSAGVMEVLLDLAYALEHQGTLNMTAPQEDGSVGSVLQGLINQTGNIDLGDFSDPGNSSYRRSQLQGMARDIAAGRMF